MRRYWFFLFLMVFLFSSCSVFPPVSVTPQNKYLLTNVPHVKRINYVKSASTLLVMRPSSLSVYDTKDMAYSMHPLQTAYFSKNQWAARPADMLQSLILQTLQKEGLYRAVVASPFTGARQRMLETTILEFQEDATHLPAFFRVKLHVVLIRASDGKVLGERILFGRAKLTQLTPGAAAVAANQAVAIVLHQLVLFCSQYN